MGTPFEDEFDIMDDEEMVEKFDTDQVNVSEETKLSEIKKNAMEMFRLSAGHMEHISGDKIIKFHEICQKWLEIAKDAEYKMQKLKIDRQRVSNSAKVKAPVANKPQEDGNIAQGDVVKRDDLYSLDPAKILPN